MAVVRMALIENNLTEVERIVSDFPIEEATPYVPKAKKPVDPEVSARMRELGRKGGRTTADKYGSAHMSAIGKAGFKATLETGGYSDAGHLIAHLFQRGRLVPRA